MLAEPELPWIKVAEVAVWSLPALAAAALTLRAPAGERRPWGLIALVCSVFASEEVFDILGRAHHFAQQLAHRIDPDNAFKGDNLIWRGLILTGAAAVGIGVLIAVFRGGRIGLPCWIAFGGLCTIALYVVFRLMPGIGHLTAGPAGLGVQAVAWCLLMGGVVMEFERRRDRDD